MAIERITVSMSESDIDIFERNRTDMGMTKSAYIRFLISEHENKVPAFLKYKPVIEKLSELNTSVKELMLSKKITDLETMHLFEEIKITNELLQKMIE